MNSIEMFKELVEEGRPFRMWNPSRMYWDCYYSDGKSGPSCTNNETSSEWVANQIAYEEHVASGTTEPFRGVIYL